MKYSYAEAIELIIMFYTFSKRCWVCEVETNPLAKDFIKNGLASIDEEKNDVFRLNSKGDDVLHLYIKNISFDFISFMKKNGFENSKVEIINWYLKIYELKDCETAEIISDYICRNLNRYGYNCEQFHSSQIGEGWSIKKIN